MVPKRYPNEWGRIALMGIVWLLALPLVPVAILVWACFYLLLNLKRMIFDRFAFAILTRGTIDDAWNRCIPFWRKRGGINDWRGVWGRPSYWPSGARRLGWYFADRFHDHSESLFQKTQDDDAFKAVCAVDVLKIMASSDLKLLHELANSKLEISESVLEIIRIDFERSDGPLPIIKTLGDYFGDYFQCLTSDLSIG